MGGHWPTQLSLLGTRAVAIGLLRKEGVAMQYITPLVRLAVYLTVD